MNDWEWESFERIINEGSLSITDVGPLLGPVKKFSIKRNENLELILETVVIGGDVPPPKPIARPLGTVQTVTDKVELSDPLGMKLTMVGVQPYERLTSLSEHPEVKETSSLTSLHATKNSSVPQYTIDWLANVDNRFYYWPHTVADDVTTLKTRTLHSDGFVLSSKATNVNRRNGCVNICVNGFNICLGKISSRDEKDSIKRGFILYKGTPSNEEREKIRNCLSFSLGMYLVYLGYSTFDSSWYLTSFEAVSAHILDKDFSMPVQVPAFIGARGINELDAASLARMVNALYSNYDDLNFRHLSWMYWHAVYAPVHAAPVLFGATIEALQRTYIEKGKESIQNLLEKTVWKGLKEKLNNAISSLPVDEDMKKILTDKIVDFKKAPQKMISERLFQELNLELGASEKEAWKQRDYAGHGSAVPSEDFTKLIRDNKLLRIRFHRMLLRMTQASDNYYDFYTIGHAVRKLHEPVP